MRSHLLLQGIGPPRAWLQLFLPVGVVRIKNAVACLGALPTHQQVAIHPGIHLTINHGHNVGPPLIDLVVLTT